MQIRFTLPVIFLFLFNPLFSIAQSEEFYGSFSSWANLKTDFHAAGDGIQDDTKALQLALNEIGRGIEPPVLFIPKGTYRITSTLTMQTRMNIAIIGEDPENTIIKWDGAAGAKMFLLDGVSYSEYSRITWDGNNKAAVAVAHEWDGRVHYANSGTQHSDEIFRNVGVGLKSGTNMDAEFSIRRCRFYNCSSTAISLQGANALDWWIWDCYFENCNVGVANNLPGNGAGNFNVYRSIFKNSVSTDISLNSSNFFSFRDNISYNSGAFISAVQYSNSSPITFQHNTIINNNDKVMVNMFTKGNVLFVDNTFITPDSNKNYVISYLDNYKNSDPDLTIIGNSFTATKKILQTGGGRVIDIDNRYGIAKSTLPSLDPKPFEPFTKYPVYEINNSMTALEIQSIIDKATATNKKTILHFRYGNYNISKTLEIKGNASLILFGDALQSSLKWTGNESGPILQVDYPAEVVLKNLNLNGNGRADGILVYDNDMLGNTIYANELLSYHGIESNLFINGFANTDFRFENLQHNYCARGTSLKMVGTAKPNATILKVFGCASVGNGNCYGVDKNGRIVVYDDWYENGNDLQFMQLKNNGEFVFDGGKIANTNPAKGIFINIDSFSGKVVLAQVIYNEAHKTINFSGTNGNAQLLMLGTLNWTDSTAQCYNMNAPENSFGLRNIRYNIGKGSYTLPDEGNVSDIFFKNMLSTLRKTSVAATKYLPGNHAHFTIDRVMVANSINNFRVEKSD